MIPWATDVVMRNKKEESFAHVVNLGNSRGYSQFTVPRHSIRNLASSDEGAV